jgi:hypothetical protein
MSIHSILPILLLILKYLFSVSLSSYIVLHKTDIKKSLLISTIIFLFYYFSFYYYFLMKYSEILIKLVIFIVLCLIFVEGNKKEKVLVGFLSFLVSFILDLFI